MKEQESMTRERREHRRQPQEEELRKMGEWKKDVTSKYSYHSSNSNLIAQSWLSTSLKNLTLFILATSI